MDRKASKTPDKSSANLGFEAKLYDVRWRPSGARQTAKGSPQGERGGVDQFGVPPKGNANFAWVQHFIHHRSPQGMACVDFVCLRSGSSRQWQHVLQPVRRLPCAKRIFKAEGQTAEPAKATRHPPRLHRGRPRGQHGRPPR